MALAFVGCGGEYTFETEPVTVVTVTGPSTCFEYRDTVMGYDYEMMQAVAARQGFEVNWIVVDSLPQAVEMVSSGAAMILAAEVPEKSALGHGLRLCGPVTDIEQVLVQPPGDTVIVDVRQLAGRTVYVEKNSEGEALLRRLNDKERLGINVRAVMGDSIATELVDDKN